MFFNPSAFGQRRLSRLLEHAITMRFPFCYRTIWLTQWLLWALYAPLVLAAAAPTLLPFPSPPSEFSFADPYFESVGDVESIPEGGVVALVQDAKGWLWIATPQGLIRWDGYRLRKYVRDPKDSGSLPNNQITALWAGHDGKLWLGLYNEGVAVFDPVTERFTHFGPQLGIAGGKIRALVGDTRGGIWIAADEGLDYLPPNRAAVVHFRHEPNNPNSLAENQVYQLIIDHHNTLWIGGGNGLQRLKKDSNHFERIASNPLDRTSLAGREVRALFKAADGKLWIGTHDDGAAWIEPDTWKLHWLEVDSLRPERLSHPWINRITQPRPEQIWLGSYGGGIHIVSAKDGRVLQRLQHDPSNPNSLRGDSISALFIDQSGLLWVGTWGAGLQRHNPHNQAFRLLRHSPTRPDGLSRPSSHLVLGLADRRILVANRANGMDILDRRAGLIGGYRPYPAPAHTPGRDKIKLLPHPKDGSVQSLLQSRDHTLWMGTQKSGLFHLVKGQWQAFTLKDGLPSLTVIMLLETRDGTLWAGTSAGLARWLPKQQRFEAIKQRNGESIRPGVAILVEDHLGRLWFSNNAGLWCKPADAMHLQNLRHDPKRPDSLIANDIQGMLVDRKGQLWVSTNKGLDRLLAWDGHHARFEHSSALAGYGEREIGANLLEDKLGRIWSEKVIFDPNHGQLMALSKADGLDIGAAWQGAYASTEDGLFLFGGSHGMAVIDPLQFKAWNFQPQVQMSEVKIDGKVIPAEINALTLQAGQRTFSIEFSALDFSAPEQNRYAYRLLGYDKDWISTDFTQRSASYGNLAPGQYTLQIRGSNRMGQWSTQQLALPVKILPAFWQTNLFRLLMLLALLGSIYAVYRLRVAHLHTKAHILQARAAEVLAAHNELAKAHGELGLAHHKLEETHQRLQATQQQLFLQEKMAGLGTLTAGVAHEINNPTNFTHVAAQIQRTKIAEFEQYVLTLFDENVDQQIVQGFTRRFAELQENVNTMLNGTQRIIRIVKDLRAFTRQAEAEKKSIHLSECLNATLHLVRTSWLEQVEFMTEYTDDPEYECWPALLNQVFMNLLVNACQAIAEKRKLHNSQAKGRICLRLKKEASTLTVQFEDDGTGIDPQIQARILEPFFTTKEVGSGTGLGLSISYGMIQKHNGTLSITSTPGVGSCFTIHLPLNP